MLGYDLDFFFILPILHPKWKKLMVRVLRKIKYDIAYQVQNLRKLIKTFHLKSPIN